MKITKTRLKEIIKEEVVKIFEAGRPHALRGGRTMKDLDDDAKTRETDFLKKKKDEKEEEELDEMSAMSNGAVAISSEKKEPLEEEDGWDEPHV